MAGSLKDIYESSLYKISLGPHSVTLSVNGVVDGDASLIFGNPVCIITAWNPSLGSEVLVTRSEADNNEAQKELEEYLREEGYEFYPAAGFSPDGSHQEPSFAVFRMEESEARQTAKMFGQKAIFYYKNGSGFILWTE